MTPSDWLARIDRARFHTAILSWYRARGRCLPWRGNTPPLDEAPPMYNSTLLDKAPPLDYCPPDPMASKNLAPGPTIANPYHVLVSEIMLQQTQVITVLNYFARFVERFPTVRMLAEAAEVEVLHHWQGLGYYRRARALHQAARRIVEEHGGHFPRDPTALAALPGLGRYTANAILSFAFGLRVPILEANTVRLWSRLCAAAGDPARQPLRRQLWELAEAALPLTGASDFNQALMDLGATICTARGPRCPDCPVQSFCQALVQNETARFPELAPRRPNVDITHVAVVTWHGARVLIVQRPPTGRWANLWEFPRVELASDEAADAGAHRALREAGLVGAHVHGEIWSLRHGIMHFRVQLRCFAAHGLDSRNHTVDLPNRQWVLIDDLPRFPFSSPQRRLVAFLRARSAGDLLNPPNAGELE